MGSTEDASKVAWRISEERFFYEYLRVAGDRSVEDCCRDISNILGSKSVDQVHAFYQKTLQWLVKGKETHGLTNKKMHGILTKFYETFVAPKRTQKKQDSIEELSGVDKVSPTPNTKEGSKLKQQQIESVHHEVKQAMQADVANLRPAHCVEILLVPLDENLANSIASSGCDPCPRLRCDPLQKVVVIIDQLRNCWDVALGSLGKGGIRFKVPEDGPLALKPFSWGDPIRDRELTILDLMAALQVSSPSTFGYVWESYSPVSMPKLVQQDEIDGDAGASPQQVDRKSLLDILNSDSLPAFSPKAERTLSPQENSNRNNVFEFVEQKRIPIGLNKLLESQTVGKQKTPKKEKKRLPKGRASDVPPGKILKSGWMQYAGAMQQIQNYNLMQGNYCPSHIPARKACVVPVQYPASEPYKSIADKKEESLLELLQNQDSTLRASIAEALRTSNADRLSNPEKLPPTSTPQSNKDLQLDLSSLSPPSSFKLPSEFPHFNNANNSPIRTLKGIFDSCYPAESPDNAHRKGSKVQKNDNCVTLKEECNFSALDVHPTTSILSFLDGLSNSRWMGMIDNEKNDAQEDTAADTRPFAKLFDK